MKFKKVANSPREVILDKTKLSGGGAMTGHTALTSHRAKTSTVWTIVIAFSITQIVSLCDHATPSSSTSTTTTTTTSTASRASFLNPHGKPASSIFAAALAGSAPSHLSAGNSHRPQAGAASQQHQHHHQRYNQHATISSPSPMPSSQSAAFANHHQQDVNDPISMYQPRNQQEPGPFLQYQHHYSPAPASGYSEASPENTDNQEPSDQEPSVGVGENNNAMGGGGGDQLLSSGSSSSNTASELQQDNGADEGAGAAEAPVSSSLSARDRCKELISLTLLSFKDLSASSGERAPEELDCANLREQIAAASGRSTGAPPVRSQLAATTSARAGESPADQDQTLPPPTQLPTDDLPLAPQASSYFAPNQRRPSVLASQPQTPSPLPSRQNTRANLQLKPASKPLVPAQPPPQPPAALQTAQSSQSQAQADRSNKNSYINQVQQLLLRQQLQQQDQRKQEQDNLQQFYAQLAEAHKQHFQQLSSSASTGGAASSVAPQTTSAATTFESLLETTTNPYIQEPATTSTTTTTTTTTTSTTTTTTTTPRPANQPKIRVGAPPGERRKRPRPRTSTTTTTTTTTTQRPASTSADYVDGSDVSTDYYDDYDDQQQPTTTTTTTQRPRGRGARRQGGRRRTSTTTAKPTTTTTLSPGYQPRPDGRIIDYMADPNFPRELKGADLTNYPFYINVPEKIDFDCKGRHDGYYSNINLHCQIYHHCAIGNRYDFLCPNYTLFDQTTFTCRFINTVDCPKSTDYYDRNNALYVEKDNNNNYHNNNNNNNNQQQQPTLSTSSSSTTTTTTTSTTTTQAPRLNIQMGRRFGQLSPAADKSISALALIARQGGGGATSTSTKWSDTTIK